MEYWNNGLMGKIDFHCKLQNSHGKMQNNRLREWDGWGNREKTCHRVTK
jgi:hypothetical protein